MDAILTIRRKLEEAKERFESKEVTGGHGDSVRESLNNLAEKIEFDAASLYLLSKRTQRLHKISEVGGGVNFIDKVRFDKGSGLSGWVAKKQQPVYLPDIHRGSRHGQAPIRSYISIPILSDEEVLGVLNLSHIKPNSFERAIMAIIRNFIENLKPILQIYQRHHHAFGLQKEKDFTYRR